MTKAPRTLCELAAKWRELSVRLTSSPVAMERNEERAEAFDDAAEELDAALAAATPASTKHDEGLTFDPDDVRAQRDRRAASDFCPKCHKLILEPDANYGVNPDVICMCAAQRDRQEKPREGEKCPKCGKYWTDLAIAGTVHHCDRQGQE